MNATRQAKTGDHPRARLLLRLCAALGGGYICTVALTTAAARFATLLGMPRSEAVYLGSLLALPLYLALLLWSFCEPRLRRLRAAAERHRRRPAAAGAAERGACGWWLKWQGAATCVNP